MSGSLDAGMADRQATVATDSPERLAPQGGEVGQAEPVAPTIATTLATASATPDKAAMSETAADSSS
ncbi:MAG: hypothetical protein ACHQ02_04840, partial [Candidatus Limnocylindrales bacterium]